MTYCVCSALGRTVSDECDFSSVILQSAHVRDQVETKISGKSIKHYLSIIPSLYSSSHKHLLSYEGTDAKVFCLFSWQISNVQGVSKTIVNVDALTFKKWVSFYTYWVIELRSGHKNAQFLSKNAPKFTLRYETQSI